jgi:hypothetical protein
MLAMVFHRCRSSVVAVVAVVSACTGGDGSPLFDTPPRDDSPAQTDRLEYTLHPELVIGDGSPRAIVTYTNRRDSTVLYQRCHPSSEGPIYTPLRAEPDSGPHVVGPGWACVGGVAPGEIAPGASLVFTAELGSCCTGDPDPFTLRDRTGLFRIDVHLFETFDPDRETGIPLPDDERQSNVIQILPPE